MPSIMPCSSLARVRTAPGRYHLIVGVPDGPVGSDADYSFVRRALRIRRR